MLFVVFIDDIDVNIRSTVPTFPDDTKLGGQGWNRGGQVSIEKGSD